MIRKLSATQERALNRIVDKLYQEAYNRGVTWERLAERSDVGLQTIVKLGLYQTKFPQFKTVEGIAQALGGSLQFSEGKFSLLRRKMKRKKRRRVTKLRIAS